MAWEDKMIPMLRILINDMSNSPDYTDDRLQTSLTVGAHYVITDIDFTTDYTITIDPPNIDPDPTLTASRDDAFTNFVVLKTACIIDQGTLRSKAALMGLKARVGPAWLETMKHNEGFALLMQEGTCKTYAELKKQYQFGTLSPVKAVLSPFLSNNWYPKLSGLANQIGRDEAMIY